MGLGGEVVVWRSRNARYLKLGGCEPKKLLKVVVFMEENDLQWINERSGAVGNDILNVIQDNLLQVMSQRSSGLVPGAQVSKKDSKRTREQLTVERGGCEITMKMPPSQNIPNILCFSRPGVSIKSQRGGCFFSPPVLDGTLILSVRRLQKNSDDEGGNSRKRRKYEQLFVLEKGGHTSE